LAARAATASESRAHDAISTAFHGAAQDFNSTAAAFIVLT
jgi:hypothetical protein